MIVVSNTSPLTNLSAIGQFNLLHALYDEILIAESVWQELNAYGKIWPGQQETAVSDWITQKQVMNQTLVTALQKDLDRGEAESIALALPRLVLSLPKHGHCTGRTARCCRGWGRC